MSSTFPTELDQIEPVGSPSIQWGIITPGSIDPSQWHRKEGSLTFSVEVQCSACNTLHDFSLMLDYEAQSDAYKRFKALSAISGAVVTCTNAGCAKTLAIPFAKYTESRLILPFNPKTSTNTVKTLMNGRTEAASKGSDAHRRYVHLFSDDGASQSAESIVFLSRNPIPVLFSLVEPT